MMAIADAAVLRLIAWHGVLGALFISDPRISRRGTGHGLLSTEHNAHLRRTRRHDPYRIRSTEGDVTFGSLFSGIGGMDLGLERAGMECRWQVEIDPYCTKVLERHWPKVKRYGDITTIADGELERVDIIAGGFPCQDVSFAGTGAGLAGARSGLWFEMLRIVRALRPRCVLVENVAALTIRGFGRVLADLAASGFDAEWDCLSAGYFGAPHERERIYILAYPNESNGAEGLGDFKNWAKPIFAGRDIPRFPVWLQAADCFVGVDDGLPKGAYRLAGGGLGNAVVPQIAEWIGKRIIEAYADRP